MNPYSLALLCFGFCSFFVGMLILLKRPDAVGKIYFVFSLFNSFWGFFFGIFWSLQNQYEMALFYARLADLFALFIPVTWLHFTLIYSEKIAKQKKLLMALYLCSIFMSFFSFSHWFIPNIKTSPIALNFTHPGVFFHFFVLLFAVVIPYGSFLLIRKINSYSEKEKQDLKGFIIATSLGFIGGGLTIPPGYDFFIPQYAIFVMPFYPFITAYFLIRGGLFHIEDLAQAAHKDKLMAIGVLAASINHEVRNPLYVIKGLAESCLERQKEGIFSNKEKALESANDAMKRSMDQAERAMDIIKRLSMFAKSGIENELKFESIKIAEVLEDVLPLVRYELAAHNIALIREIPQDLPEVRADRRYLEEILFNLIVNAAQAIKGAEKMDGEIKISGSLEEGKVLIKISDNGPGIPDEKLQNVFKPFYTTKEEGTGLGLYITKQLVEKIHGKIEISSNADQITTFSISVPCNSERK